VGQHQKRRKISRKKVLTHIYNRGQMINADEGMESREADSLYSDEVGVEILKD